MKNMEIFPSTKKAIAKAPNDITISASMLGKDTFNVNIIVPELFPTLVRINETDDKEVRPHSYQRIANRMKQVVQK